MKFKIPFLSDDEDINMAPMIDMVFLLLIFFMVASHMDKLDRTPVELPVASESSIPEQTLDRTLITVRSIDFSGEEIEVLMNLKKINFNELKEVISKLLIDSPDTTICLRVDRYAKHKHVKKIMNICAENGVDDVIFSTFESGS